MSQQSDAIERMVNLAAHLSAAGGPLSVDTIRYEVEGYPADQDHAAFQRMFERDKDALRDMGFVITSNPRGDYVLDAGATFASEVTLDAEETALVRVCGSAFVNDPSFPYAADLRVALAKLTTGLISTDSRVRATTADEHPAEQGHSAAELDAAIVRRKTVTFTYPGTDGSVTRTVHPYGLLAREGRWYLVGRDVDRGVMRTFSLARITDLGTNTARRKEQDFEPPEDFDLRSYVLFPFQYGDDRVPVTLCFSAATAWRAPALGVPEDEITPAPDGELLWDTFMSDVPRMLSWIIENGPGIRVVAPPGLAAAHVEHLRAASVRHTTPDEVTS